VPSFRRKASVTDAGSAPVSEPPTDKASPAESQDRPDPELAQILAEEAEAEAAEAEAAAAAARARARALRLRRQAQEVEATAVEPVEEPAPTDDDAPDDEPVDIDSTAEEAAQRPSRRRLHLRVPLPTWKGVALFLAVLCTCALLAASGYMIREHRQAERDAQLAAEYTAAGRQAVVTLMSLDFNKAEEGVQRIIDNSTGKFREDFQQQAETFAQVAQDSKVITEVTVNSAAVSTMTEDSANVLVSATSRVTNAAGANKDPRGWRLSVDLERDGDQVKMSRVEFVP
jgi:Mce-associated membrane protein